MTPTNISASASLASASPRRRPALAASWILMIFNTGLLAPAAWAGATPSRLLSSEVSAAEIRSLEVRGGSGEIQVRPSPDDQLHIEVRCQVVPPEHGSFWAKARVWFGRSDMPSRLQLLERAKLETELTGNHLTAAVLPNHRARLDQIQEVWTISVPPRFALKLGLDVGHVSVEGIEGGVQVDLRVGDTLAALPDGNLRVRTDVGDVTVQSKADVLRRLEASTRVGQTSLAMRGISVPTEREHGPGGRIQLSGKGSQTIEVIVDVGDVTATFD